jgi:hypothetical protein
VESGDTGLFAAIYEYVRVFAVSWWWWAGFLFGVERYLERHSDRLRSTLDRFVGKDVRGRWITRLSYCSIFLAGFFAWNAEHHARMSASSSSPVTRQELEDLRSRIGQRRLNKEQRAAIDLALAEFRGLYSVDVDHAGETSDESERFALDFAEVFRGLNWQVTVSKNAFFASNPNIIVLSNDESDPVVARLGATLLGLGFQVKIANSVPPQEGIVAVHADEASRVRHFHIRFTLRG